MKEVIKNLLNLLNQEGTTYLVGGAVRSYLISEECHDLDFATTLSIEQLANIFPNLTTGPFASAKVEYHDYHLDITHLRTDIKIINGYPKTYQLTDDLLLDSNRRDITIDAIYLDKDLKIIDPVGGYEDYLKHQIKIIGSYDNLNNDPLRIVRIIRMMVTLDFNIEENLQTYINNNINLISNTNINKLKQELTKITNSPNLIKYMKYLEEIHLFDIISTCVNENI